jgi:hypothetical protein
MRRWVKSTETVALPGSESRSARERDLDLKRLQGRPCHSCGPISESYSLALATEENSEMVSELVTARFTVSSLQANS